MKRDSAIAALLLVLTLVGCEAREGFEPSARKLIANYQQLATKLNAIESPEQARRQQAELGKLMQQTEAARDDLSRLRVTDENIAIEVTLAYAEALQAWTSRPDNVREELAETMRPLE